MEGETNEEKEKKERKLNADTRKLPKKHTKRN